MQGLILAAGMGKRLKSLTQNNTKCMIKVNGVTLIERALRQLDKLSLSRIIIVIGYQGDKLVDYIDTLNINTPIIFVNNPIYFKTNNIYSLALAKNYLVEDSTLLLESDLIFEDDVLNLLINDQSETLALVDKYQSWMDGTCIKVGENDHIEAFIPGNKFKFSERNEYYKTVNIYKFGQHFSNTYYVPFLEAYQKALGENEYYEQVLRVITMLDEPEIKAKKLNGQLWYEIDDIQDLDIASSMFTLNDHDRTQKLQKRYGGYWRYPYLLDFCYLVNPFFPPQKLIDEIMASFKELLTSYPSGMQVNSLLASKNFGVKQDNILVGNGAAELIKVLMSKLTGKFGIIKPTFEEYPNRLEKDCFEIFYPENDNFSYTENDIIDFFSGKIRNLVLINPDNPSGNYIQRKGLIKILDWSKLNDINIILDESFSDFSDETNNSLIDEKILNKYPNLIIIKSISKSYGVPGLRLGILVSSNSELIQLLKNEVSIWNINSFAEFYLQIAEKYSKDYSKALEEYRVVRKQFIDDLKQIEDIRVIPTQANFVMIEILRGYNSLALTDKLLAQYNILIKDLSSKLYWTDKQYVRLAIRNREDNAKLIHALSSALTEY